MVKTILFQTIQFCLSIVSISKTIPFQTIGFSIQKQFHFKQFSLVLFDPKIGPNQVGQSGPASNGNEGAPRIPQNSSITRTSPSDCLVSYPGHLLEGSFTPQQRCSWYILQPHPTGQARGLP